jgi:hypothetical protein
MPRALSVARVTVAPPAEPDYLRTVAQLARLSEPRGRRLWLFRSAARPGSFLECSESSSRDSHRTVGTLPEDEQRLEHRLREIASYSPDGLELWEEVAL